MYIYTDTVAHANIYMILYIFTLIDVSVFWPKICKICTVDLFKKTLDVDLFKKTLDDLT